MPPYLDDSLLCYFMVVSDDQGVIEMLSMTRRVDESIIIDDDIEVAVLEVNGNQVKIGITAPDEVSVHREEVYIRINQQTE